MQHNLCVVLLFPKETCFQSSNFLLTLYFFFFSLYSIVNNINKHKVFQCSMISVSNLTLIFPLLLISRNTALYSCSLTVPLLLFLFRSSSFPFLFLILNTKILFCRGSLYRLTRMMWIVFSSFFLFELLVTVFETNVKLPLCFYDTFVF